MARRSSPSPTPPRKKRGRPPGARNKPKIDTALAALDPIIEDAFAGALAAPSSTIPGKWDRATLVRVRQCLLEEAQKGYSYSRGLGRHVAAKLGVPRRLVSVTATALVRAGLLEGGIIGLASGVVSAPGVNGSEEAFTPGDNGGAGAEADSEVSDPGVNGSPVTRAQGGRKSLGAGERTEAALDSLGHAAVRDAVRYRALFRKLLPREVRASRLALLAESEDPRVAMKALDEIRDLEQAGEKPRQLPPPPGPLFALPPGTLFSIDPPQPIGIHPLDAQDAREVKARAIEAAADAADAQATTSDDSAA